MATVLVFNLCQGATGRAVKHMSKMIPVRKGDSNYSSKKGSLKTIPVRKESDSSQKGCHACLASPVTRRQRWCQHRLLRSGRVGLKRDLTFSLGRRGGGRGRGTTMTPTRSKGTRLSTRILSSQFQPVEPFAPEAGPSRTRFSHLPLSKAHSISRFWRGVALYRPKLDELVLQTQHINLRIVVN